MDELDNNLNILQNHICFNIFKLYVYQSRGRGVLNLNSLIEIVTKVEKLERKIASVCKKKPVSLIEIKDLKITI